MSLLHRIPRLLTAAVCVAVLVLSVDAGAANADALPSNKTCLRCHGMATLGYQDPITGSLVSLAVDGHAFAASNHAAMTCVACHGDGYTTTPHPDRTQPRTQPRTQQAKPNCLGCHATDAGHGFKAADLRRIGRQFSLSLHFKALPGVFDCSSCHDTHAVRFDKAPQAGVQAANAICRTCHDAEPRFSALTSGPRFQSLEMAHQWLPVADLHWRSVRCVECHTPRGEPDSHTIVRGDRVERDCVACHSKTTILLSRLYQHRARQGREEAGFFSGMLNNEAYIIGMTRSFVLDTLSLVIFVVTLAVLGGHGLLRLLATRRKRS